MPVHIALYLCHALQEHFAIHSNGKLAASGGAVEGKKVK